MSESTESMDEMELETDNFENEAEEASDFISGLETTIETEDSNLK